MADKIQDFAVNSDRWLSLEDFEGEIWKDIPGYDGWYQVSNMGRIKSLDREYIQNRSCDSVTRHVLIKGKIIKPSTSYGLYNVCHLKKNGTSKFVKFHRIVCSAFHDNPHNYPEVNHKNEIKTDNRADNLEWCTRKYNATYGTAIERASAKTRNHPNTSRPIYQFSQNGVLINSYPSTNEAERQTGILAENILSVANGKKNSTAGGYIWSYYENMEKVRPLIMRKAVNRRKYAERPVLMFSKEGKLLKRFSSIVLASKETGIHKDTIGRCCKHEGYYKTAGGFKWEYE